ncbi:MAG TPA: hypothetical protein DF296_07485 [Candidatus Margulisbacteria bacterium]|nr:MAG: hypothetical protein A2X42_10015 [Candidatus Margulisbacteria bacterium GWF2_38_17]HCT85028.1 hypothetical protein [Candidatus Margulisiibacteriota bacterium]
MKNNRTSGFSMLEVIITIALLSIIITPLYSFFIAIGNYEQSLNDQNNAYLIAASLLEKVSDSPFDKIGIMPEKDTRINQVFTSTTLIHYIDKKTMQFSSEISPFKQATVKVAWRSSVATENVVLSKIITR